MRKVRTLPFFLMILMISLVIGVKFANIQPISFLYSQDISLSTSTNYILGNETEVASYFTQYGQGRPAISSFTSTTFLIAWYGRGWASTGDDIYLDQFNTAAQNYTDDVIVNTNLTETQQGPAVSSIPDGSGFVVAWYHYNGPGDAEIYAKIFDSSISNTTDDILVNGNGTDDQNDPSVGCFSDGSFVVTWTSAQTGDRDVYAKIFNSNGINQTDDILVNTITSNDQFYSDVFCQSDGSFVVTWSGNGLGDSSGVFMKIFDSNGDNVTDEMLVNSYLSGSQIFPSICGCSDDSYVIAWQGAGTGDPDGIFAKIFNSNGVNQTEDILVNANTTGIISFPSVSCFSDNSFIIAWQGAGEGDDTGIFARKLNSKGQAECGDIRINLNTTGNQEYPDVCCLTGGIFVVTWQSDQAGNSDAFFRIVSPVTANPALLLLLLQGNTDNSGITLIILAGILVGVVIIGIIVSRVGKK